MRFHSFKVLLRVVVCLGLLASCSSLLPRKLLETFQAPCKTVRAGGQSAKVSATNAATGETRSATTSDRRILSRCGTAAG